MSPRTPLDALPPPQRFMYEYGCFVVFWGNFEVALEVAICKATNRSPKDNCFALATLPAGERRKALVKALDSSEKKRLKALENVFQVADRNSWIHGTILNPKGDFSSFTRLRVEKKGKSLTVSNSPIDTSASPFTEFYPAFQEFMDAFEITPKQCNEYIVAIQSP